MWVRPGGNGLHHKWFNSNITQKNTSRGVFTLWQVTTTQINF
jgi:hypothetical protein